jgi:hypothetical protein
MSQISISEGSGKRIYHSTLSTRAPFTSGAVCPVACFLLSITSDRFPLPFHYGELIRLLIFRSGRSF